MTIAACGDGDDDGPSSPFDDPNCHIDCFGSQICRGDVLVTCPSVEIPCDAEDQTCPSCEGRSGRACAEGCVDDPCVGAICEEDRVHRPGDACVGDEQCDPSYSPDVRLVCGATGTCESIREPVLDDAETGCGSIFASRHIAPSSACAAGICFVPGEDPAGPVGMSHCTAECELDWQCPVGHLCVDDFADPMGLGVAQVCAAAEAPPAAGCEVL